MLRSHYFIPTLKEIPAEAVISSHQLMLRAGLIRKVGSGLYVYLPMGYKALIRISEVIRQEMNRAGALEFSIPLLVPMELWQESGRWNPDKQELMRLKDRHDRMLILSPTNEENFTDLFRNEIHSYRDLPVNFYQIGTKFRDEIRPRYGVMRAKEFLMKDAYSFDLDETSLDQSYKKMQQAYYTIFQRCRLKTVSVKADSGDIGGDSSEEFMVESVVGEDEIVTCECGYVANMETADDRLDVAAADAILDPLETVHTPDVHSIEQLVEFFTITPKKFIKSLIYRADDQPVMVLIRGDKEINEVKLKNLLKAVNLQLADSQTVTQVTGADVGYAGPLNLKETIPVYADHSVRGVTNGITGANQSHYHLKNVTPSRDLPDLRYYNLNRVDHDSVCAQCGRPLNIYMGIEVGHIFKLGDKYTKAMQVTVTDQSGQEVTPLMGCYGIGVGRTLAAVIEQNHDQDGIIWPIGIAPFDITILTLNTQNPQAMELASQISGQLEKAGYQVLVDDRNVSPGFKFKDADLIGIPVRINLGDRSLKNQEVEIVLRRTKEVQRVRIDDAVPVVIRIVQDLLRHDNYVKEEAC